jgi:lysophospholipase L1-like esterase
MNPNPNSIRILCFGDSNTWGRSGASTERYSEEVRWTALVQSKLGTDYEIIEEGLRSRTTNIDDDDPRFPHRHGLNYLIPCLESHEPLDVVILFLGTNDLKTKFNRIAEQVVLALQELITHIKATSQNRSGEQTKILLVSPPVVREDRLELAPHTAFSGAGEKSKQLGPLLAVLSQKEHIAFLDLAPSVIAGEDDGVHLDPDQHALLAPIIVEKIKELNL